jgi:hypothetical protein
MDNLCTTFSQVTTRWCTVLVVTTVLPGHPLATLAVKALSQTSNSDEASAHTLSRADDDLVVFMQLVFMRGVLAELARMHAHGQGWTFGLKV